jgi:hypothetical protein
MRAARLPCCHQAAPALIGAQAGKKTAPNVQPRSPFSIRCSGTKHATRLHFEVDRSMLWGRQFLNVFAFVDAPAPLAELIN